MSLKSIGSYGWGLSMDITNLPNYTSEEDAFLDLDSCGNTAKIVAAGDSRYTAAWAAHEYSTEGTSAGDWCLPAAGIISSIYNHQQEVNTGLVYGKGEKFTADNDVWSSSERNSNYAWMSDFGRDYGLGSYYGNSSNKGYSNEVRPVLEF